MTRYPAETPEERNRRIQITRAAQRLVTLYTLIADLSPSLADEDAQWSQEGLDGLRRRVANALPPPQCPDWLTRYRDPPVVRS